MSITTEDLLNRLEANAILYFQTKDKIFFDRLLVTKSEIVKRVNTPKEHLREINEIVGDFYTEGDEIKRLPKHLVPIANELAVIYKISVLGDEE